MTSEVDGDAERALRDMLSLLTLPALWVGKDAGTIVQLVTEAIETIVNLDISFFNIHLRSGATLLSALRVSGYAATGDELTLWAPTIEKFYELPLSMLPNVMDTPLGPMRILRLTVGLTAQGGSFWFGSKNGSFPSAIEAALLRAAVTLAATGLQTVRLDQDRQRASRAKDEFLAMLGHELRNPLAPIFNSLALIKLRSGQPLEGPHAIIERQARHLTRLVDDLLDVSRIASGKIELNRQSISLSAVLTHAVEAVEPLMMERQHHLVVSLPEERMRINADFTRMAQVFVNLMTNAAKYTPLGGLIQLRTNVKEGHVFIDVEDNGSGITPDLKPRLFEIFEQGLNSIDRAGGGLGVGLALVRNFVQLHEGEVHVHSAGTGCGATFTVVLPLERPQEPDATQRTKAVAVDAPRIVNGIRVLLVDDNVDSLETMASALEMHDLVVATATCPDRALAVAIEFQPQIAVLDIGLPVMSGYELAQKLREAATGTQDLRIISLSGYGQSIDHRRSAEAGLERHLVKPIDIAELIDVIACGR